MSIFLPTAPMAHFTSVWPVTCGNDCGSIGTIRKALSGAMACIGWCMLKVTPRSWLLLPVKNSLNSGKGLGKLGLSWAQTQSGTTLPQSWLTLTSVKGVISWMLAYASMTRHINRSFYSARVMETI